MLTRKHIVAISYILETYDGRDKFLKTLSYAAKLATLFTKSPETLKKFHRFGSKMSECRVILRLMDDIPILSETIAYGWGRQEPIAHVRLLKLLRNAVEIISSPIEHICWAGEQKLVETNESFWDDQSTRLWVISVCLSLLISLTKLFGLDSEMRAELSKNLKSGGGCRTKSIESLTEQRKNQMLTCLRLSLDLTYAISYLPSSGGWGYRLKTWQVGLLGTTSSIIGIYQLFAKLPIDLR